MWQIPIISLGTVVITGAAGTIGAAVREGPRGEVTRLVLADRVDLVPVSPVEEARRFDLLDLDDVVAAFEGADSVVHLGGVPDEAPRPDGLYGVSKVAMEALGRLYADKFGVSVVCLRIGSYEAEPSERRHLSTWLSPRDCLGFVRAALTASDVDFATGYAVSANTAGSGTSRPEPHWGTRRSTTRRPSRRASPARTIRSTRTHPRAASMPTRSTPCATCDLSRATRHSASTGRGDGRDE